MFKNIKKTGFDDVDLLIEFEQTFSVKFTDEEAARIYKVQDLFTLLIQKIPFKKGSQSF